MNFNLANKKDLEEVINVFSAVFGKFLGDPPVYLNKDDLDLMEKTIVALLEIKKKEDKLSTDDFTASAGKIIPEEWKENVKDFFDSSSEKLTKIIKLIALMNIDYKGDMIASKASLAEALEDATKKLYENYSLEIMSKDIEKINKDINDYKLYATSSSEVAAMELGFRYNKTSIRDEKTDQLIAEKVQINSKEPIQVNRNSEAFFVRYVKSDRSQDQLMLEFGKGESEQKEARRQLEKFVQIIGLPIDEDPHQFDLDAKISWCNGLLISFPGKPTKLYTYNDHPLFKDATLFYHVSSESKTFTEKNLNQKEQLIKILNLQERCKKLMNSHKNSSNSSVSNTSAPSSSSSMVSSNSDNMSSSSSSLVSGSYFQLVSGTSDTNSPKQETKETKKGRPEFKGAPSAFPDFDFKENEIKKTPNNFAVTDCKSQADYFYIHEICRGLPTQIIKSDTQYDIEFSDEKTVLHISRLLDNCGAFSAKDFNLSKEKAINLSKKTISLPRESMNNTCLEKIALAVSLSCLTGFSVTYGMLSIEDLTLQELPSLYKLSLDFSYRDLFYDAFTGLIDGYHGVCLRKLRPLQPNQRVGVLTFPVFAAPEFLQKIHEKYVDTIIKLGQYCSQQQEEMQKLRQQSDSFTLLSDKSKLAKCKEIQAKIDASKALGQCLSGAIDYTYSTIAFYLPTIKQDESLSSIAKRFIIVAKEILKKEQGFTQQVSSLTIT